VLNAFSVASTVLNWLSALPDALIRARPMLCTIHALALLFTNGWPPPRRVSGMPNAASSPIQRSPRST
jgi:hypothetical protein